MKVLRKINVEINNESGFKIGDQIQVGEHYTATCQEVGEKDAIFMFDQYLDECKVMMKHEKPEMCYKTSDLRLFLIGFSEDSIFDNIRESMVSFDNGDLLRIPTAEELFGPEEAHKKYEILSNKRQWPLMKDRHNRVAFLGDKQYDEWGWLQNKVDGSDYYFAFVYNLGHASHANASHAYGVRVVFRLSV